MIVLSFLGYLLSLVWSHLISNGERDRSGGFMGALKYSLTPISALIGLAGIEPVVILCQATCEGSYTSKTKPIRTTNNKTHNAQVNGAAWIIPSNTSMIAYS